MKMIYLQERICSTIWNESFYLAPFSLRQKAQERVRPRDWNSFLHFLEDINSEFFKEEKNRKRV